MKVTVSTAAKLTGKTRATIYNHIKKGLISAEKDGVKGCQIDTSELSRFYGNLQVDASDTEDKKLSNTVKTHSQNLTKESSDFFREKADFLQELLDRERDEKNRQLDFLRRQLEQEREEKNRLLSLVENQTRQLADQRKKVWWFK